MAKSKKLPIILGLGAAFMLFLATKGQAITNVVTGQGFTIGKVTVSNFKINTTLGIIPSSISFTLNVTVNNNNNLSVPVNGFVGNLFYGNEKISSIGSSQSVTIQGQGTTIARLGMQVSTLSLGTSIKDVIQSGNFVRPLTVIGSVNIAGIDLPVNANII